MTFDPDDRVANWASDGVNLAPVFDLDGKLTVGPPGRVGASILSGSLSKSLSGLDWCYVDSDFEGRGVGADDGVTIQWRLVKPVLRGFAPVWKEPWSAGPDLN